MKIVINALFLRARVAGGMETYVTNIIHPWYMNKVNDITFLCLVNHLPDWWEGDKEWFKVRVIAKCRGILSRIFYEQLIIPRLSLDWDVLFSPGYVGIIGCKCPQVITVHDAFAWILPKEAGRLRTLYWRWMIAYSVKFVAAVIAVSVSTRNDLLKHTQVNHSKVHVIPEAGDHVPLKSVDSLSDKISNVKGYFIAVGFFKAVKNPFRILAAYEKYRATMLNKGYEPFGIKLIGAIYGLDAKKISEMASLIPGIEILGRIDDAELYKTIGEAHGFIFPSIYEGFGLPILEAQRLGCPVLTSRVSSMPEVAGEGALLVDPLDIESIYQGMLELHCSEKRVELVRKGLENESRFSWRFASSKTFELLCSVAQQKN